MFVYGWSLDNYIILLCKNGATERRRTNVNWANDDKAMGVSYLAYFLEAHSTRRNIRAKQHSFAQSK